MYEEYIFGRVIRSDWFFDTYTVQEAAFFGKRKMLMAELSREDDDMDRKCGSCGQAVGEMDLYCIHCGALLEEKKQASVPIEKQQGDANATPLSLSDYMLMFLIMMIPVVNIVLLLVWAFDRKGNRNRRNFAKAGLIYFAIGIILTVVLAVGLMRAVVLDERQRHYEYHIGIPEFPSGIELAKYYAVPDNLQ